MCVGAVVFLLLDIDRPAILDGCEIIIIAIDKVGKCVCLKQNKSKSHIEHALLSRKQICRVSLRRKLNGGQNY